jgi:hypothetical protein
MQYFCGFTTTLMKNGNIVAKIVVIVVSIIHGITNLIKGALLSKLNKEGIK